MDNEKLDKNSLKYKTALLFSSITNNLFNTSEEEGIKKENECTLKQTTIIENIVFEEKINDEEQSLIDVILPESEKTTF